MKLLLVLLTIALLFLQAYAEASSLDNAANNLATTDALALRKKHSHGKINCKVACTRRCSKSSRKKICHRTCTGCCKICHCVPPGTYGNKQACPCYATLRTHGNKPKCP